MLNKYRHYENISHVNFVPLFPSVVTRISVNKSMISLNAGCEISVMYIDGKNKRYDFNQFLAVLWNVHQESQASVELKDVIPHEIHQIQ